VTYVFAIFSRLGDHLAHLSPVVPMKAVALNDAGSYIQTTADMLECSFDGRRTCAGGTGNCDNWMLL
jgi:hypothetical protein